MATTFIACSYKISIMFIRSVSWCTVTIPISRQSGSKSKNDCTNRICRFVPGSYHCWQYFQCKINKHCSFLIQNLVLLHAEAILEGKQSGKSALWEKSFQENNHFRRKTFNMIIYNIFLILMSRFRFIGVL